MNRIKYNPQIIKEIGDSDFLYTIYYLSDLIKTNSIEIILIKNSQEDDYSYFSNSIDRIPHGC